MKTKIDLSGWNLIIYQLIASKFANSEFCLKDIYEYESEFKKVYPDNFHIKDKIRQTLQNLRDCDVLSFVERGSYQLKSKNVYKKLILKEDIASECVYLLSNESITNWVKIGRTKNLGKRVKDLYNTSVPLPFKLEDSIGVNSSNDSRVLEKSIHSIIDTINPDLRKNTEANRREFFKISVVEARKVFELVRLINTVEITE